MARINIVTTTITNNPYLTDYFNNISKYIKDTNHIVKFLIVGDYKTPDFVEDVCDKLNAEAIRENIQMSFVLCYPHMQDYWLDQHKILMDEKIRKWIVPDNSPRRRNFGYLWSLEDKPDYMIVVDDDNYPLANTNWLDEHISNINTKRVFSNNSIVNPCEPCVILDKPFRYARGYPKTEYFKDTFEYFNMMMGDEEPLVNTSIWQGDPDVDAQLLLYYDRMTSCGVLDPKRWIVCNENYIPINSQNTCVKKEVAPIYWNVHMPKIFETNADRYDDIWGGLFLQKCTTRRWKKVSFGNPIVNHNRNKHDYIKDFRAEYICEALNSDMWKYIMGECDVYSTESYLNLYQEIAENILRFDNYKDEINTMIHEIGQSMLAWIDAVEKVM